MGAALSSIMKNLASDSENEKTAQDALNSLVAIAQNRQEMFYDHITSPNFDPKTIPINKVIYKYQFFRCGVAKEAGVVDDIKDSLDAFVNGDTANGLAKIATSCFSALFGTYSANQSQKTVYAITTGELGGVSRIDADFYSYEYTSDTLAKITKNVVVVSIVVSSAKIDELDFNDVSTIVQTVYTASTTEEKKKIRDQIWEAVELSRGGKPKGPLGRGKEENAPAKSGSNVLDGISQDVFDGLNGGVHGEAPKLSPKF
ncbi:hypothetical protein SCHPADRAFT_829768 [Schizopora paradoxa]|uniref:Uncharacterized protein n=1 Tax=Schizopora paradoxa TaxID=27342 RepID=A0A0H2S5T6_9AGAM|nr:hypothetical protein SCHPADRAFT_829768 [Schizopora paradoxa]